MNDISNISIMSITSPPKDEVDIRKLQAYILSQGFVIKASAYWIDQAWEDHIPFGGGNVGGADAFGIYFDNTTNIHIEDSSFYTYTEELIACNTNLYPYKSSAAGVVYKAQDKFDYTLAGYTWDSAHITVWPIFSGPVDAYVRSNWSHTWSSTDISSIGVSESGISVYFTKTSNAWDGESQYGYHLTY